MNKCLSSSEYMHNCWTISSTNNFLARSSMTITLLRLIYPF